MPVYEYECHDSGHRFVQSLSMDDHDKRKLHCPNCRSRNTDSLIEAAYVKAAKKS